MKITKLMNYNNRPQKATEIFNFNNGEQIFLKHYSEIVAMYKKGVGYIKTDCFFSKTTSKNINIFIGGAQCQTMKHDDILKEFRKH